MKLIKAVLAWGGLIVLLAIYFLTFTVNVRSENNELSSSLEQKQRLLARLENLPKREGEIRNVLESLDNGLAERSLYVGDAAAVRTEIQRDLRKLATNAKVQLASMRPLGSRRQDDILTLSAVQLNYMASHDDSMRFLRLLEEAEPILRVQRMSVTVASISTETSGAMLSVNLEVSGFTTNGEGP